MIITFMMIMSGDDMNTVLDCDILTLSYDGDVDGDDDQIGDGDSW